MKNKDKPRHLQPNNQLVNNKTMVRMARHMVMLWVSQRTQSCKMMAYSMTWARTSYDGSCVRQIATLIKDKECG